MSHRVRTHLFALAAMVAVAVAGAARPAPAAEVPLASSSDATQPDLQPAERALDIVAPIPPSTATGAVAGDQRQAVDQPQAIATGVNPAVGLPTWVKTVGGTQLWSSSASDATSATTLPLATGTTYLKPLGPFADGRVEVYFPGDDVHPPAQGWVDDGSVAPSGVPPWIAPSSGDQQALLPAPPRRVSDTPAPDTTAAHVAIIDDASGQLIYGEAPSSEVPQASTTKIATTIVALERSPDLSRRVRVTVSASAMVARDGSSTMGLEPGRSVSLDTLLHGMMLPSGNDAAEQVALALAGSREQYVQWMNDEAVALGLKDTHFVNPSGMDAAGHYSSAYDMAMLARYAMRNPIFRQLAAATRYQGDGYRMQNLNRMLDVYPGADGVKIGFTDAALKTIVASATRDGHRVFVSLMRSQDLVGDCTALFDWVWNSFAW